MRRKKTYKASGRAAAPFNFITKPIGPLCNIHCEYCFYLDKEKLYPDKGRGEYAMNDEVLKRYVRQYISSQPAGTTEVNFIWQGGEPTLLGIEFYERAIKYQQQFKRPGMDVANSLQTNGTLINEDKAKFFSEHDFLLGISIDGPEKLHDRYRKDRSGNGTFKQVMKGLEIIQKHNIRFNTLTVVQQDNSKYPLEVYNFLKDIGSTFMQFIPIVETAGGSSPVSERTVSAAAWGGFLSSIFDEWVISDIGKIFVGHFDMMLGIIAGYPASMCVHAKTCGRALAIEHNGDVYSCDHFVFPENYLGNIKTTSMRKLVDSPVQSEFGNSKYTSLPEECLDVEFLQLCYGGCPKNRLTEAEGGKLNWLCNGYREIYVHSYPYINAMKKALDHNQPAANFAGYLM